MSLRISMQASSFVRRNRRARNTALTSLATLAAVLGIATTAATANAASADYTNVANPLHGMTHLLRDDDLVVALGYEAGQPAGATVGWLSAISTTNSTGLQTFPSLGICFNKPCTPFFAEAFDNEQVLASGRFFNSANDSFIEYPVFNSTSPGTSDYTFVAWTGASASDVPNPIGKWDWASTQQNPYPTNATTFSKNAVADFNGDGFDDLLMVYSDYSSQWPQNGRARIATAKSLTDPSQGFSFSAESYLSIPVGVRSVATGDFNGDGQPDFAVLYVTSVNGALQLNMAIYSVDQQFNITQQGTPIAVDSILSGAADEPMQISAGTFTSAGNQQLVVTYRSGTNTAKVSVFDFALGSYTPVLKQAIDTGVPVNKLKLAVNRFAWANPNDSIALMMTNADGGNSVSQVEVISVDPNTYALNVAGTVNVPKDIYNSSDKNYVALDIAIGNFDNQRPNPIDTSVNQRNPDLQLAIAVGYCQGQNLGVNQYIAKNVNFFDVVDPTTGVTALKGVFQVGVNTSAGSNSVNRMTIIPTDLQGRSLRLGGGYKISLDRQSPKLLMAQPPMHVDYALPLTTSAGPTLINLSMAPDGFNATYSTTSSTNTKDSESNTKGWSFAGKETVGTTMSFGVPGATKTQVQASFTAQQAISHSTDSSYGSLATNGQTITTATRGADGVWYDDGTTYLYVYDVAGQTACPAGATTCADADRVPLTVMFSAPGASQSSAQSAENLEWYQPVWENGNILSYPGNQAQLFNNVANASQLTPSLTEVYTDSLSATENTNFSSSQTTGTTVMSSHVYSESSDVSVEMSGNVAGLYSASDKLSVSFGGSDSLRSVRTDSTTITQSTGFTLNKTATFAGPEYSYGFVPVIYSQSTPANYADGTDPLTSGSGLPPLNAAGVNTFGPVRAGYWVDPLGDDSGDFFQQYSTAPDVALNHPVRWSVTQYENTGGRVATNCLKDGSNVDCVEGTGRNPADPREDPFHAMRGLFVYKSTEANPADPAFTPTTNQGYQQISATAGDQMTVEARVYNYSTAAMQAGSKVRVNFYAMPWNKATDLPVDPRGGSFLIGKYTSGPIQPFNTTTPTPNYILANTTFDTTTHTGPMIFWVMAWGVNADGSPMGELAGKGLTRDPDSIGSTNFDDYAGIEPMVADTWSPAAADGGAPPQVSFSNNIGVYPQQFEVLPKSLGGALGGVPFNARGDVNAVSLSNVEIGTTDIRRGESTELSAIVGNTGAAVEGATARFYDGDPMHGGMLAATERLPHVGSGDADKVRVRYTPTTCGKHEIFLAVSHQGKMTATVHANDVIQVDCPSTPNGNGSDAGSDPDTEGSSSGGGGGCNVVPGGAPASGGFWFLGALGMALTRLVRRKRNA